jgi:hypothetical protein
LTDMLVGWWCSDVIVLRSFGAGLNHKASRSAMS